MCRFNMSRTRNDKEQKEFEETIALAVLAVLSGIVFYAVMIVFILNY